MNSSGAPTPLHKVINQRGASSCARHTRYDFDQISARLYHADSYHEPEEKAPLIAPVKRLDDR
jgi:hypothetical protein